MEGQSVNVSRLDYVELAVTEKALVVAQSLWRVRKDMFTQVYWQHTARTLKAMLGYVVRNILRRLDGKSEDNFWGEFQTFVFSPISFCNFASEESVSSEFPFILDESIDSKPLPCSHLSATDDALLNFLWKFSDFAEKTMIQEIRVRKVYRRFAVLSNSLKSLEYRTIYDRFSVNREKLSVIEGYREECEKAVIREAVKELRLKPHLLTKDLTPDELEAAMKATEPLLLVDVPIKGSGGAKTEGTVPYLPEDIAGVHSRELGSFPGFKRKEVLLEERSFDTDVGKIRVLAHPQFTDILVRTVPDTKVFEFLSS